MHRCAVACVIACCALLAGPAMAPAPPARRQVAAAFIKQRTAPAFSMVAQVKGESGPVEITVEYIPPDRMRQTIVAPGQPAPLETVLVGHAGLEPAGRQWEELMPAIAQTIIAQVREAVVDPPKDVGEFECLDKATIDGKEYLAYRSVEKRGRAGQGLRSPTRRCTAPSTSIPQTGLPAINVVAEDKPGAVPFFKGVYAYPTDLVIEGHPGAPLAKMQMRIAPEAAKQRRRVARANARAQCEYEERNDDAPDVDGHCPLDRGERCRRRRVQGRGRRRARAAAQVERLSHGDDDAEPGRPRQHDGRLRAARPHAPDRQLGRRIPSPSRRSSSASRPGAGRTRPWTLLQSAARPSQLAEQMQETVGDDEAKLGDFECLGKQPVDGKDLLAYQGENEDPDPKTGAAAKDKPKAPDRPDPHHLRRSHHRAADAQHFRARQQAREADFRGDLQLSGRHQDRPPQARRDTVAAAYPPPAWRSARPASPRRAPGAGA